MSARQHSDTIANLAPDSGWLPTKFLAYGAVDVPSAVVPSKGFDAFVGMLITTFLSALNALGMVFAAVKPVCCRFTA